VRALLPSQARFKITTTQTLKLPTLSRVLIVITTPRRFTLVPLIFARRYHQSFMRLLSVTFLLPLLAANAGAIQAAPTTTPDTNTQIESLIPQLSSDTWSTRQQAQDQLITFGDQAIPRLQRLLNETTDAETRLRAQSTLALISENRTAGVSLITLHYQNVPVDKILADLSRQCYSPLPIEPATLLTDRAFAPLTINIDKQPFWLALKEICTKTHLRPHLYGPDQHLALSYDDPNNTTNFDGPSFPTGPFLIVANNAQQTNAIYFAQPQNITRTLNLTFTIFAEPKLHILSRSYTARITQATDDHGRALADQRMWPQQYYPGPEVSPIWSINAPLVLPPTSGSRITHLTGQCRAILQSQSETWEIPDILHSQPRSKTVANRTYRFQDLKENPNDHTWELKLSATRDPRFGYNPDASLLHSVQLLSSTGHVFPRQRYQTTGGDATHWQYTLYFSPNPNTSDPPTKMTWDLPLETQDKELNFDFADLPLP